MSDAFDNPPGGFHRLFGRPFSSVFNKSGYERDLFNEQTKSFERKKQIQEDIEKSNLKKAKYQRSMQEHKNAAKWGYGYAFLHGFVDTFSGSSAMEEAARIDIDDNPIERIKIGREQQYYARHIAPKKLEKQKIQTENLLEDLKTNEARLKRLNVQIELLGHKVEK